MAVSSMGGAPKELKIKHWDWQHKIAKVKVKTLMDGKITPARLSIIDSVGHPLASPIAATYFDSENGHHYFYSDGEMEIEVPYGEIKISAVRGMMGIPEETQFTVSKNSDVEINLFEIWNAKEVGYHSADFHLHLNYDGPYRHVTSGIEPLIAGENLDIATPQAANLHNRLMDREFLGETIQSSSGGLIKFSQEVRSHFHGHIGVVGPSKFYFPWFWGPGYPKLNNGNLSNASVFEFVNSFEASIGTYVHPVAYNVDPFNYKKASSIPLEFIPDSILSKEVGLELVCAWSDELGTTELWYRLLNIGRPVIAMAGTDMFVDFHRTPAIGTARVFAQQKQDSVQWAPFIKAVKEGRSFVTNTPVLLLELGGKAMPGDVIDGGKQSFSLYVTSAIPVENIELIINGKVAWIGGSIKAGISKTFNGEIELPKGGWIAARAHGGKSSWPLMDSYPFGHTSPIWINYKGSTDPTTKAKATREIKQALRHIEERAKLVYKGDDISILLERIELARAAITK
jgi:TolB protein